MDIIKRILDASKDQGYTCMYSNEELESFPQDKLNNILEGIICLGKRGPWKKKRGRPVSKTLVRYAQYCRS